MTELAATDSLSFEEALSQLEAIVSELERGETALDESIARFERGVALARRCEDRLNEAEKKLVVLVERGTRVMEVDMATGETLSEREAEGDEIEPVAAAEEPVAAAEDHPSPDPDTPAESPAQQSLIDDIDDDLPF